MSDVPMLHGDAAPQRHTLQNSPALELGSPRQLVERTLLGLGLSSLFGLALGMHDAGLALLTHALAIPAGLALTTGVTVPSLYIALAMLGVPVKLRLVLAAIATGLHHAGKLLAGLAPLTALLVVTIREPFALTLVARAGLEFAGLLTLYRVVSALREANAGAFTLPLLARAKSGVVLCGFLFLVINLAQITFTAFLPLLRGV
jgi:hypothetical protein